MPSSGPLAVGCQSGLFLHFGVRVDNVTGLILGWVENHLGREITKLVDAMAFDILELNQKHALLRPFSLIAELDIADDGFEGCLTDVSRQRIVVKTFGRLNGVAEDLQISVGPHRHIVAQRIDTFGGRTRLIFLKQLHRTWKLHGGRGDPRFIVDNAIEQRSKLRFEYAGLQANHGTAPHLWLETNLVDRLHESDGVERIGADEDKIRIVRLDYPYNRRKVGRRWWIVLVVHDL